MPRAPSGKVQKFWLRETAGLAGPWRNGVMISLCCDTRPIEQRGGWL
jgi:hypothetical protein